MKQIIPFKKDILFKTKLSDIISISLEHKTNINKKDIYVEFIISGEYKMTESSVNKEIFIVFGIYFIAAGKKRDYFQLNSDDEKINYITNYFKNDLEKMSIGSLIEKEINGKIFDDNIISSLYQYSYKYIHIISPSRFQKANKDIAIFVFIIKNILEHIGTFDLQNIKPDKEYILYHARLQNNKAILDELNKFFDKINS